MAATYNKSLTTDKDRVRFKIGDTETMAPLFDDEEIQAILVQENGSILNASIVLVRSLVFRFARLCNVKADDVSKEASVLHTRYSALLESLVGETAVSTGQTISGQLGSEALADLKIYC